MRRDPRPDGRPRPAGRLLWQVFATLVPLAVLALYLAGLRLLVWQQMFLLAGAVGAAFYLGRQAGPAARDGRADSSLFYSLLEAAPIGIAVVSGPENRLDLFNPVYCRIVGRPQEDLAGRTLRSVFPEPMARVTEGYVREVCRTGRTVTVFDVPAEIGEPARLTYWDMDYVPLLAAQERVEAVLMLAMPVTEQVRARQEAGQRAAQLQAVLAAISDAIWVLDTTGNLIYANEMGVHYLGVGPGAGTQEITRVARRTQLFRPDGSPITNPVEYFAVVLQGEPITGKELVYRLPGGPERWARVSALPVRDAQERITGAVVTATDITAEKQAQARLESAGQELQTIINQLPDGVLVIDTALRVTQSNRVFNHWVGRDMTGALLPDLLREYRLLTAEGRPFAAGETPIERAIRGETVSGMEVQVLLPDGKSGSLLESAAPLCDPEGRITGAALAATDITELKRVQADAEDARRKVQATLDQLADAVVVVDMGQRITLSNETLRRKLGYDVVGMSLPEVWRRFGISLEGKNPPSVQTPAQRALRGEMFAGAELHVRLPGGEEHCIRESAAPLRDAEGQITGAVVSASNITALRQAQAERDRLLAEVQAGRENLHTIINQLPDWVMVVDPSQRITLSNDAVRQYMGQDPTGQSLLDLSTLFKFTLPGDQTAPPGHTPFERALRGERVQGLQVTLHMPDGRRFELLEGLAPLRDAEGHITGAVVAASDITALKQVQAEVEAARQNLATTLEWLPMGVLAIDASLHVTLSNRIIRQFLGRDLVGLSAGSLEREFRLSLPNGAPFPAGQDLVQRALRGEVITGYEALAWLSSGRRHDLLANLAPLRGPEGQITGVVMVTVDITPQKEAQAERERLLAEVQSARQSLRAILDQLPEAVLVIAPDMRISLCNDTIRRYVGYDPTGRLLTDVDALYRMASASGQPFPQGETPFERALRGELLIGVEAALHLPDGQRIDALVSAAPLSEPDGRVQTVAIVLTDVTPLKELDRAKDEFISVAAHELRTPLTSLKGHAQILIRRAVHKSWATGDRRSLQTIDDQVDRLNDLVDRLLNVSRIRVGRLQLKREPTDIVVLAQQVAADLQVTTEAHQVVVRAEQAQLIGNWDPATLTQVLANLISNAIKYAPGGPIDVHVRQEGGQALVSISDRGPGIPPEQQKKLFEAFMPGGAREYRHGGGLGLGLYISRGIIEAHGGRIWVQSQPGAGATFTFSLPING